MNKKYNIYVDGACSGNPGKAGVGVVIFDGEEKIKEISEPIGEATNNIAEYTAVIHALQAASQLKGNEVKIYTDSELVFSQLIGRYKIKDEKLKLLFEQVKHLIEGFKHVDIENIPREKNKDADKLARQSLKKKKQVKMVASTFRLK